MSARLVTPVAVALVAILGAGASCEQPTPAGARELTVASEHYTVRGEYSAAALDRVDGVKVERGRLVVKGVPADLVVDVPASADLERPARHWALVTEANVDGHRLFVFTEAESVRDVSFELPDGEAPLHFDVFATRDRGEILVFATGNRGTGAPSLYGHVIIKPK